jgi:ADP-dependent glucokinase
MLIFDGSFATSADSKETEDIRPKRIEANKSNPGAACWTETIYVSSNPVDVKICIAPVLVCKEAKKTVGAGDNISAVGVATQI